MIGPNQSSEQVNWRYTALTGVFVTMAQNADRINRISTGLVNMTDPHATTKRLLPIQVPMMCGRYLERPARNASSTPPGPKLLRDEQRTQGICLRTGPAPRDSPNRSLCRPQERQAPRRQVDPRQNRIADAKEFAIRGPPVCTTGDASEAYEGARSSDRTDSRDLSTAASPATPGIARTNG